MTDLAREVMAWIRAILSAPYGFVIMAAPLLWAMYEDVDYE
jgi:hypothetical protein